MFSVILFWTIFTQPHITSLSQPLPSEDSIAIFGSCWDVTTGIDLSVKVTAKIREKEIFLGESNKEGLFDFPISISTSALTFEAKGYRPISMPVSVLGKSVKGDRFRLHFRMIALDSQQVAKPFNSLPGNKSTTPQIDEIPKSHFQVRDAYQGKTLTAKICLTFTRTGRTYCLDTDSTSLPTASFVGELDNIHLKVSAAGFQDYEGTLKTVHNRSGDVFYQIKLLKTVFPVLALNLDAPDGLEVEYRGEGAATAYLPYVKGRPWKEITHENAALGAQSLVAVQPGSNTILGREKYIVVPGLNLKSMHVAGISKKPPLQPETEIVKIATPSPDGRTLYFDQSSYNLRSSTKQTLDSISEFLRSQRNLQAHLTGHTDNVGPRNLNVSLSEYRARVVANYLLQRGVKPGQIIFKWKGPDSPIASNHSEEHKTKNRRVEILFMQK
jgi:outer membrane protein OmpA-like peptidoglycan-associated protein